jgi:C4-dicarboxylate transporter DctM subunit
MTMSLELLTLILVVSLAVMLMAGQWTAFALGICGVLVLYLSKGWLGLTALSSVIWNNANSYILIAVPMFLLMGEVILRSGVSTYFYRGVAVLMGRLPGGLLHANIASCAVFSAVSGSSAPWPSPRCCRAATSPRPCSARSRPGARSAS